MRTIAKCSFLAVECSILGAILGVVASLQRFSFCYREAAIIGGIIGLMWGGIVVVCFRGHTALQRILLSAFIAALPFSYLSGRVGVSVSILTVALVLLVWQAIFAFFSSFPAKRVVGVRNYVWIALCYIVCVVLLSYWIEIVRSPYDLIESAARGDEESVRQLIEQGVFVNARDGLHQSAIAYACARGNKEITEVLLEGGSRIDGRNRKDRTPLMIAARHGHYGLVRFLVQKGAKTSLVDVDGLSATDNAKRQGHREIAEFLEGIQEEPGSGIEK